MILSQICSRLKLEKVTVINVALNHLYASLNIAYMAQETIDAVRESVAEMRDIYQNKKTTDNTDETEEKGTKK